MRSLLLGTRKGWLSILAIAIVPLLYSGAYLSAYWNPYGHLSRLPIDIVNQDKGAHGEHLGADVARRLPRGWDIRKATTAEAARQLKNGTADLAITIPADYTEKILRHQTPAITFTVNPGSNYLNDLLMQKESVALTQQLNRALRSAASRDMAKSLHRASSGAQAMGLASHKLYHGAEMLNQDGQALHRAALSAAAGAQAIHTGSAELAQGSSSLASSLGTLSADTSEWAQGAGLAAANLERGQKTLQAATAQAAAAVGQISGDVAEIRSLLAISSPTPQQAAELASLQRQVAQDQAGLAQMDKGLASGPSEIGSPGGTALAALEQQTSQLAAGIKQAAGAASQVADSSQALAGRSGTLAAGIAAAAAEDGRYDRGVAGLKEPLEALGTDSEVLGHGLSRSSGVMEFMVQPVSGTFRQMAPASNYGKGLSPYFLALSLWVGALVVTVIVPGGIRKGFGLRQVTSLGIGLAQSAILAGGILLLLPLSPVHLWAFWGIMGGIAVTWWAVMRLLSEKLGDGGRLLGIVLLVVQLAGSAGTYPIQLSPALFGDIHPYLPMTWAIHLLRYAVSGAMPNRVGSNILWLALVAAVSWAATQFIPGRIPFNSPPLEAGLDESGPLAPVPLGSAPPA